MMLSPLSELTANVEAKEEVETIKAQRAPEGSRGDQSEREL
jgi:hypothetical protein